MLTFTAKGNLRQRIKLRTRVTHRRVTQKLPALRIDLLLESGTPDDDIIVENFDIKARVSNHGPFIIVRTRQEVDMQWDRTVVSTGLPMSCIGNKEVRKTDLMTADCGQSYIRTKPGGVKKPRLSHRTYVTIKLVPKLDKFIDDKNMHKMREMTSGK
jgi:hypothetical protein